MTEKNTGKTDMEENLIRTQAPSSGKEDKQNELGTMAPNNETQIKEFGNFTDMKKTEEFLLNNPDFIHESTALAMLKWCTTLTGDSGEPEASFETVSTQCLYILYLLDLARQVDIEPVYCVTPFFARISEPEFREMFEKEIIPFRSRLQNSSWDELIDEVLKANTSDDDSSLSCGSSLSECSVTLDPIEMYNSLPPELQQCIDNEDIEALEAALNNMPDEQADAYMARFLQAGLFIPIGPPGENSSDEEAGEVERELGTEELYNGGEDEEPEEGSQ